MSAKIEIVTSATFVELPIGMRERFTIAFGFRCHPLIGLAETMKIFTKSQVKGEVLEDKMDKISEAPNDLVDAKPPANSVEQPSEKSFQVEEEEGTSGNDTPAETHEVEGGSTTPESPTEMDTSNEVPPLKAEEGIDQFVQETAVPPPSDPNEDETTLVNKPVNDEPEVESGDGSIVGATLQSSLEEEKSRISEDDPSTNEQSQVQNQEEVPVEKSTSASVASQPTQNAHDNISCCDTRSINNTDKGSVAASLLTDRARAPPDASSVAISIMTEQDFPLDDSGNQTSFDEENQVIDAAAPMTTKESDAIEGKEIAPKKKRSWWGIAVLLLILLVALVVVAVIVIGQGSSSRSAFNAEVSSSPSFASSGAPSGSQIPSDQPSLSPSLAPTLSVMPSSLPSSIPSSSPSSLPSSLPSFVPSSVPSVSAAPSSGLAAYFEEVTPFSILFNSSTPQFAALEWLEEDLDTKDITDVDALLQRYALTVLDFSLTRNMPRVMAKGIGECSWFGVVCDELNGKVTSINWARFGLTGEIPDEIKVLSNLKTLDLGENEIEGSIPKGLYEITGLQNLFLLKNKLRGELDSDGLGNMYDLLKLYVNENQLSGPFPSGLKTDQRRGLRPLRHLNLAYNNFSGPLPPENLYLHFVVILDLSHNNFSGQLSENFPFSFNRLSVAYLSHNQFEGPLPNSFERLGSGRILLMHLNDNRFTGRFNANYEKYLFDVLKIENNRFSSLDTRICRQGVFSRQGGEMVHFKADCNICTCDPYCQRSNNC